MTAQELAERLEVSQRTIYRDMDALSSAGIPIYTERGPGGGCELIDGYQTKLTGLSIREIHALFLLGASRPMADLGLDQALEGALLKLAAALPATTRIEAVQTRQRIYLDSTTPSHTNQALPHLEILQEAVWQNCTLVLTCDKENSQLIDPYGLVSQAGEWYLIGASAGSIWICGVSRIQAATMTGQRFQRPPAFDLATYWRERRAPMDETCSDQAQKKNKLLHPTHLVAAANTQPEQDLCFWRNHHHQKKVFFVEERQAA